MLNRRIILLGTLFSVIVVGAFVIISLSFKNTESTETKYSSFAALDMLSGEIPDATKQSIQESIKAANADADLNSMEIVEGSYQKSYYPDNDQVYTVSFSLKPADIDQQFNVFFDSASETDARYNGVTCQPLTKAARTDTCFKTDFYGE